MKKLSIIASAVVLTLALSANAASWTCTGKNVTASFGQTAEGLFMSATSKGAEYPGNLVDSAAVELKDIKFKGAGKGMKDVAEVVAKSSAHIKYKATLNIQFGGFALSENGKIIASDKGMVCKYYAGE